MDKLLTQDDIIIALTEPAAMESEFSNLLATHVIDLTSTGRSIIHW